jgi:plasmid stabilization system protein ParE
LIVRTEPRIYYHRLVAGDVRSALRYYREISPALGAAFREELQREIATAARKPLQYHLVEEFRRLNLRRFPYHVLFQPMADGIRVMLVRHNRRHPSFGLPRR